MSWISLSINFFHLNDLINCSRISKLFNQTIQKHYIWRNLCINNFCNISNDDIIHDEYTHYNFKDVFIYFNNFKIKKDFYTWNISPHQLIQLYITFSSSNYFCNDQPLSYYQTQELIRDPISNDDDTIDFDFEIEEIPSSLIHLSILCQKYNKKYKNKNNNNPTLPGLTYHINNGCMGWAFGGDGEERKNNINKIGVVELFYIFYDDYAKKFIIIKDNESFLSDIISYEKEIILDRSKNLYSQLKPWIKAFYSDQPVRLLIKISSQAKSI